MEALERMKATCRLGFITFFALISAGAGVAPAQENELFRSWNQPFTPFQVAGNLYYVGANDIASYLITTPEGHILIDGGFVETVSIIRENVQALGFRIEDVKVLLNNHAHNDHAGGLAELKAITGAMLAAMEDDIPALENGGAALGTGMQFPPVEVDRVLVDGETIGLGGVELRAHRTAGHTPGCTTWTLSVEDEGTVLQAVIVGSLSVLPDTDLVNNNDYPAIADDYRASFSRLKSLDVDLFLGSHGAFFGLVKKAERLGEGGENPFVDPDGFRRYIERKERRFLERLEQQMPAAAAANGS